MKKIGLMLFALLFLSCNDNNDKFKEKGFQIEEMESDSTNSMNAISKDSLSFKTKSVEVLLTGNKNIRITPLYKVNYSTKEKKSYTGSNEYYYGYNNETPNNGNYWNSIIPGFEALYGYNLVNIFHFNHANNIGKKLFPKSVLIKTFYYPSFSVDTLNYKPVLRDYYLVSVYDEDTNNDKYINNKDLRNFYLFDSNGENKENIIPKGYSVIGAKYDSGNDYLYIDTKQDVNTDGKISENEPVSIFYLDLKKPTNRGLFYKN